MSYLGHLRQHQHAPHQQTYSPEDSSQFRIQRFCRHHHSPVGPNRSLHSLCTPRLSVCFLVVVVGLKNDARNLQLSSLILLTLLN